MSELFGFDSYSPKEIAARVETVGVANMYCIPMGMLVKAFGMLQKQIGAADD